jgi:hypothetical protein
MQTPGAPVSLTEVEKTRIVDYLDMELREGRLDHQDLENQVDDWNRAYLGEPFAKRKDFPWENACNVVIPLIGIHTDSIVARVVNTIFSVEPLWTARPLIKSLDNVAKPLEDFLDWSRRQEYDAYNTIRSWVLEVVKYGWGYIKVPWEVATVRTFKVGAGGKPEPVDRIVRRPRPQHVLLIDIICQVGIEDDINQAEWLAHRVRLTDGQLRWREYDGVYEDVDKVIERKEDISSLTEMLAGPGNETPPTRTKLNTFYETWIDFPLKKGSLPDPLVITYHPESRTVMRAIYNPHADNKRPFFKGKFLDQEGRRSGVGIAQQLWQLQEELSTIHRQEVDNSTIANTKFFVGRRGAVRNTTRIWPGRFLTVPDPSKDLIPMSMGDIGNSLQALETSALSYAERRSGVTDYQLGRESSILGGRATATGTLAIIQEGNRRFDLNVRDIRDTLGKVGQMVLLLNAQYRPREMAYFVEGEDGKWVERALNLPDDFIADGIGIELTASTATINREIEKQSLITIMGLVTQHYQQVMSMAQLGMAGPPPMQMLVMKMLQGSEYFMRRIVQAFDIKDVDAVLPLTAMMEQMGVGAQPPADLAAGNQNGGGMAGAMGPPGPGAPTGPGGPPPLQ